MESIGDILITIAGIIGFVIVEILGIYILGWMLEFLGIIPNPDQRD